MKGPARRDEPKMVSRIEHESKPGKVKKILSALCSKPALPATFDEAKACCKARKRKERQESISSLCQERKVIRSNSEERPAHRKLAPESKNMRRVSSSEDFQKSASIEKINVSPSRNHDFQYEDHEHEKRRSHERFSRPLTLKNKKTHPNRRLKVRYCAKTKFKPDIPEKNEKTKIIVPQGLHADHSSDQDEAGFLKLHDKENERSPSPINTPISPTLDFSTLHEQVNCSEPLLSCIRQVNENTETLPSLSVASNRLLSSPRNSIIATHCLYLDPEMAQRSLPAEKKQPQNPVDERLQKLGKQINSVKKKIKKQEAEFEAKNGFKPSQADKMNDKNMKKYYAELSKLKREQKQLAEVSTNCALLDMEGKTLNADELGKKSIQETVNEIEKKLLFKREMGKRSSNIEEMTSEQLVDEKVAIQKALLYLESIHGRPNRKEDRDLVRPYYDRYRTLKRMVSKISVGATGIELATIHENETMHFITPVPSQSFESESDKASSSNLPSNSTDSDTDTSIGENLHSMSREELLNQLKVVTEEKKELRRTIKEYESSIQLRTGKMVQKEDKMPMENVYLFYKKTKAKLRLLEALVGKHDI